MFNKFSVKNKFKIDKSYKNIESRFDLKPSNTFSDINSHITRRVSRSPFSKQQMIISKFSNARNNK